MAIRPTTTRPTATGPTRIRPGATTPSRTRPSVARSSASESSGRRGAVETELTLEINFKVTIANKEISVARISPLELAADADELKALAVSGRRRGGAWAAPVLPGRIVLTRAIDADRTFFGWRREAMAGKPALRTVTIRQLDRSGKKAVNAWKIVNAWPLRWTGPAFDALDGGIAHEELELVFTDLNWL